MKIHEILVEEKYFNCQDNSFETTDISFMMTINYNDDDNDDDYYDDVKLITG